MNPRAAMPPTEPTRARVSGRPVPAGSRWGTFARWRRRFFGVMRLTVYVFCANLLLAALGARVVLANLKEGTLQLGRELESVSDVLGATKTVYVNGTPMNVLTTTTDIAPKDVLDCFEALCLAHPEFLARAFADIPETLREGVLRHESGAHFGVMRADGDGDGAVSCFMDDRVSALADIPDSLKAFAASWDLLRVRPLPLRLRPEAQVREDARADGMGYGSFNLKEMFPAKGDAAGFRFPRRSAPAGVTADFSAAAAQVPFGVHIYDAPDDKDSLRKFYDDQMTSLGWRQIASKTGSHDSVAYMADIGHAVFISFASKHGRTLVTTTESGRPNDPGRGGRRASNRELENR